MSILFIADSTTEWNLLLLTEISVFYTIFLRTYSYLLAIDSETCIAYRYLLAAATGPCLDREAEFVCRFSFYLKRNVIGHLDYALYLVFLFYGNITLVILIIANLIFREIVTDGTQKRIMDGAEFVLEKLDRDCLP